jgi:hypothetical protein
MKKNILCILLVIFVLLLAQNIVYGLDVSQGIVSQDAVELEIPCPGGNFLVFLAKFVEDETFQRAFTMYPLTKLELDYDAKSGPEPFIRYLEREQVQFPVIPSSRERTEWSLEIKLEQLSDNNAKVLLFEPDTGYRIIYFFRKNVCWKLERIEDWSM